MFLFRPVEVILGGKGQSQEANRDNPRHIQSGIQTTHSKWASLEKMTLKMSLVSNDPIRKAPSSQNYIVRRTHLLNSLCVGCLSLKEAEEAHCFPGRYAETYE